MKIIYPKLSNTAKTLELSELSTHDRREAIAAKLFDEVQCANQSHSLQN